MSPPPPLKKQQKKQTNKQKTKEKKNKGEWEHSAFGADPVGVCMSSCLHSFLLNQCVEFDQTGVDTLLGRGKEVIRFW